MRSEQSARYSIDTSALIHAWSRAYPIENFPSFWASLEKAIEGGRVVICAEALAELKRRDDALYAWCKRFPEFCVEIDEPQQRLMIALMGAYPRLVDTVKGRSGADPWVIALAQAHTRTLAVVTQENFGRRDSPKIPDVCGAEGLQCIDLVGLIRAEDWRF